MKAIFLFFIVQFNVSILMGQEHENHKVINRSSHETTPEKPNKQFTKSSRIIEPTTRKEYKLRIEELKQDSLNNRELIRRMEIKLEQIN